MRKEFPSPITGLHTSCRPSPLALEEGHSSSHGCAFLVGRGGGSAEQAHERHGSATATGGQFSHPSLLGLASLKSIFRYSPAMALDSYSESFFLASRIFPMMLSFPSALSLYSELCHPLSSLQPQPLSLFLPARGLPAGREPAAAQGPVSHVSLPHP